jgi:hypothetical protein
MVDFPHPECPMMEMISPFFMDKLISRTAVYFPLGVGKDISKFLISK